jgi:hypothetical protein
MPVGWIGFSTASAPDIHELRDRPVDLRQYVRDLISNAGVTLIGDEVYFDNYHDRAYVLVEELDEWEKAKAVTRLLGADEYNKLMKAEAVQGAIALEQDLKPPLPEAAA